MAEESVPGHCGRERQEGIGSIDAKLIEEHHFSGRKVCPKCGQKLTFKEGKEDWHGLPAGVKFDPSDQELLDHLEAKVGLNGRNPHLLIDEFIPTLQGEDGICYTHPEKLPGVTRDGNNKHFFHRPSKAYTTGTRKRRKIQSECDLQGGETRWHKTGKTRPVLVNGKQKGCKKILVLYTNFGKQRKPEKTNWVMHQYHLGTQEEEKEGELVVSKVFYQTQPRQCTSWDRLSALDNNQTPTVAQPQLSTPHALVPSAMLQQPTNDKFSFTPLCQKGFEEGISESSSRCTANSCGEEEEEQRPSANIFKSSTMPTVAETHMLSQKAAAKTASLEDIFEIKEVGTSSIPNTQEVEWIKYNAPYWPDNNS